METRRDDRIAQLLQALKRSDKLHLKEAATLLGVSEMTIRRDLNGHSGPVVLLGGYIVLEDNTEIEISSSYKDDFLRILKSQ